MVMVLNKIAVEIKKCRKCRLWKGRGKAVPGKGPAHAKVMLIGQNPGKNEAKTGRPFIGRPGKNLNKVLEENDIDRRRVFITGAVKHATPGNRAPLKDETNKSVHFTNEQIKAVKPEGVVLMGKTALSVERNRGIRYIETCHPAAAIGSRK